MSIQVKDVEIIAGSADGKVRTYDLRNGKLAEDYIGRMLNLNFNRMHCLTT